MMKVLFDTNVMLDRIQKHELNIDIVDELFDMIYNEKIIDYSSANDLTNIYYVASIFLDKEATKDDLLNVIDIFNVISVAHDDRATALNLPITYLKILDPSTTSAKQL